MNERLDVVVSSKVLYVLGIWMFYKFEIELEESERMILKILFEINSILDFAFFVSFSLFLFL